MGDLIKEKVVQMVGIEPTTFRISDGCAKPLRHTCYILKELDFLSSLFFSSILILSEIYEAQAF